MAGPVNPRLLREARATRWFVIGIGAVGVAQAFLVIATAGLIASTVTHVFDSRNLDGVWQAAGWLVLVFVARGGLTWLTSWLAHRASAEVKSSLRRRVLAARLARPDSHTSTASLVTVMTTGLDALDGYFGKYLPQFLLCATVPIILGVAVGLKDVTSLIIMIVTVPLIPLFMVLIGRTTSIQVAKRFRVQLRLANHFADLVAGLPTLQVFGRARAQSKSLQASEDASRKQTMATLRVAFLSAGVLELVATLSVALIAVSIAFRVIPDNGMSLQTALYILVLAPEVYLPVRMVGVHFHDSSNGNAAANAAFAIIDAAEVAPSNSVSEPVSGETPSQSAGGDDTLLRLDAVTYRYPGTNEDALAPLSLAVHPGEIIALAGPSGAGKTTALNLALGLLQPSTGKVRVEGGAPLTVENAEDWRRRVAWAGQMPGLLGPTVVDDVALGLPIDLFDLSDSKAGRVGPLTSSTFDKADRGGPPGAPICDLTEWKDGEKMAKPSPSWNGAATSGPTLPASRLSRGALDRVGGEKMAKPSPSQNGAATSGPTLPVSRLLRDALDRVGGESIPLDRYVGESGEALSAGERRRVAMARALLRVELGGAHLLLLDEPTAGLDEAREAQILSTLRDLGVGVLVVSHREAVLTAADHVIEVMPPIPAHTDDPVEVLR